MKKLTKEYLESLIIKTEHARFGDTLTICVLTLQNGFNVVGSSACISKDIFDEEKGKQVAYDNAFGQLWELEGYKQKGQ
ncbi:MAG: hypothetical protein CSA44_00070 [Gammaproteobacteria bacterium]|nr:MAG: hypothetical protein CSA44_00070 [Gammaproteobacteria bacterium]